MVQPHPRTAGPLGGDNRTLELEVNSTRGGVWGSGASKVTTVPVRSSGSSSGRNAVISFSRSVAPACA
jgi:hypothetical protein